MILTYILRPEDYPLSYDGMLSRFPNYPNSERIIYLYGHITNARVALPPAHHVQPLTPVDTPPKS